MLHISQSTISRDINYMQSEINNKDIDPDDQLLDECKRMNLILGETVKELWKIIDSPNQVPKKRQNQSV